MSDNDFCFPSTDPNEIVGKIFFENCDPDILTTETYMKLPTEKVCKSILLEQHTDGFFDIILYEDFDRQNKTVEMYRVNPTNVNSKLMEVLEIE